MDKIQLIKRVKKYFYIENGIFKNIDLKRSILLLLFIFSCQILAFEKDTMQAASNNEKELINEIKKRMQELDETSPMDFSFNEINYKYIQKYLGKERKLISKMTGFSPYYFPMIEQHLDRFQIPLELKYLTILESSLNPRSKSKSGATGLWQFMYATGKEYGLEVTSYIDERQDPLKSTIAACEYLVMLYDMFEDWNLVLAAYNGGPGYLKRTMAKTECSTYWDVRPYLRKETQGYIPSFIAITYAMTYYKEHNIEIIDAYIETEERDTISFDMEVPYYLISEMFCVSNETLNYLNPSFKKEIIPDGDPVSLPKESIMDVVINEDYFYEYIERVHKKEILVNEIRAIYIVEKGDCLSKIAKEHVIQVKDIKEWNNLDSDHLSIGDNLILYIPDYEKSSF